MKNAMRIGSVAGISIRLHWTFLILLAGIFALYFYQSSDLTAALMGVALVLALFACVVLHELGHALMAKRFDVPTRDITLYPIGGVARLQRIPEEPMQEFWVAIAGPAVNLVIAAVLFVLMRATGQPVSPEAALMPGGTFVGTLMWMNVALVGFNMLPAFPMDGGRVLRALLATRMAYGSATQIAANVGQVMAIFFGIIGLVGFNPILLFIALFVYMGAQQEARYAMMRSVTEGVPVREAMMTRFRTLSADDTLGHAVDELLAGSDQDFPVVRDGRIVGILTRARLIRALTQHGRDARVGDFVESECFDVEDTAMLEEAFQRMTEARCPTVPVVRHGNLVGLLTLENVGELLMVSSALQRADQRRPIGSLGMSALREPVEEQTKL